MTALSTGMFVVVFLGSIVAGFVNTLASNGSLITLPLLVFAGLAPSVANATNRLGIFAQTFSSLWQYRRGNSIEITKSTTIWILCPIIFGSAIGAFVAVDIDEKTMNLFISIIMLFMLVLIVFNYQPKYSLQQLSPGIKSGLLFFGVGLYGGFIQAGVSLLILIALLAHGMLYKGANGLKLLVVFVLTIPALLLFSTYGKVDWGLGLSVALGNSLGGIIAAKIALKDGTENWIRYLLILIIMASLIRLNWPMA